jgi:hypothetical protein
VEDCPIEGFADEEDFEFAILVLTLTLLCFAGDEPNIARLPAALCIEDCLLGYDGKILGCNILC